MAAKQDRRFTAEAQRHRDPKKKAQETDFSTKLSVAVLFLRFSVPLSLCASVVNPTCLLEPVRAQPRLIKQIRPAASRASSYRRRAIG
jgi:hypothetical protein